jgi:phospholipid transport system substrate-binding protein
MMFLKRLVCQFVLFFFTTHLLAANDPTPMVVAINNQVLAVLKAHQSELKNNPKIIEQAITKYFIPHVDTHGMSRSVLGRNIWQTASPAEKNQFTNEFTQLVLRTYAQPLSNFNDEKVEFLPKNPGPIERFSQVKTVIVRPNGQRINMTYHLVMLSGNDWKVYDLSVEGVSLLNSFRNQFSQALQGHDLKTIIEKMHEKNNKSLS